MRQSSSTWLALVRSVGVAVFSACLLASPAAACGPYGIAVHFWLPHQPGPAHDTFLQGQLGILDSELDPAYRYVAYRHLTALETGPANLESLKSLWPAPPEEATKDPVTAWREARAQIPGVEPLGWLSRSRQIRVEDGDNTVYSYFLNCLDDALITAAETLTARIEQFGAESREVQAWVSAQDDVFANCDDGESIPVPLDDGWDPLIRADRSYQIAAANFYAARYQEAANLFRAIAQDGESPWHELSAYLVARALIRDRQFTEAGEHLGAALADPDLGTVHEPAQRLLAYSTLRSDPGSRRRELNERLLAPRLEAPIRQDFIDYLWLLKHDVAPSEEAQQSQADDRFGSWLAAMGRRAVGGEPPWDVARNHWLQSPKPAWLVAALVTADPSHAGIEPLLNDAAKLTSHQRANGTSPAYPTVAYHQSRLLAGLGRTEEARAALDTLLDHPDELSLADRNRLRLLRAEITPELDEYLRLVAAVPAGLAWDDGSRNLIPMNGGLNFPYYRSGDPVLPDSAVELLNHGLTTEELLELTQSDLLPEPWRRRLALTVWTRAVVTEDDDIALTAAPLVSSLAPELAAEMAAFTAADTGNRRFEATWTLLRFPGLSPVLRWNVGRGTPIGEIDQLRDNGWCDGALQSEAIPKQIVRTPEQIANVQSDLSASGATPAWPNHVGSIVLSRAKTNPDEPRLAEALHRVVRATRIGCPMGGYGKVSHAAFQLLHKRFPSSVWAKQTPYWFD